MTEPQGNSGFPLLPGEAAVRFGCGAIFGLLVGFGVATRWVWHPTWLQLAGCMLGGAIFCGFGARALGDSFWRNFLLVVNLGGPLGA